MTTIEDFENKLAEFTGAPYVVTTDCCTHAIELCFRLLKITMCDFSSYTYISVPMTMHLLNVTYFFNDEKWKEQYNFYKTPVWDSARCLKPNMYKQSQYQCLSFGPIKPLDNVRGGAILLDNKEHYKQLKQMSYDGRDSSYSEWTNQKEFKQGFHYMMRYEECESASQKLDEYISKAQFDHEHPPYPNVSNIKIVA